MIFLYILLSIILLFIYLLFAAAMQVLFSFNTDKEDVSITILWLFPFLKAIVTVKNENPILTVFLFKKKVFEKELMPGGHERTKSHLSLKLVRQVQPWDIHVNAAYGFRDPSVTGIACGAVNIATRFINIDSIEHSPDFMADKNYISIDAAAKLNPGATLVNLSRAYIYDSRR
ncbi:MAG: hypothetical protein FIA99_03085 [Ruminiclostridium sp.]|nr:hypothetical protein [Ruminiclostridium sp.]